MTAAPIEPAAVSRHRRPHQPAVPRIGPTFASLGVPAPVIEVLARAGITGPFPIQSATLPDSLAGRDILGRGQTGSGKTLAFCIPLVEALADGHTMACRPRGLVLVPTRELASQVSSVLRPLAEAMGLSVVTIYGGIPQGRQVTALRKRADIVVACPGRLADLIEQGHCELGDVEVSVLDEADHMADLGFLPVVRRLLAATPAGGQRMLFSATLDHEVDVLVRRFLSSPAVHSVDPAETPMPVVHHALTVSVADRLGVVSALAAGQQRSLIFTRTRRGASRLARQLTAAGIPAAELHGDLAQNARDRNLAAFSSGEARVLVATDIAARGLHVDGIGLVIHADPPAEEKAYVHRSGRTARAGASGTVITVQTDAQSRSVSTLMRRAGVVPLRATVRPDSELLATLAGPRAEPVRPARRPAGQTRAGAAGTTASRGPAPGGARPAHAHASRARRRPGPRRSGRR
ncbi:MAG TPA: DEAD/DEAH box helicase [Streptosporangiaceae bacterium]|nr:DEAD/DEAH box helicase [Streptosporangiaceae bacterium]